MELNGTLSLPGGQITVQGLEEPPSDGGTIAITGGTGAYRFAKGEMRFHDYLAAKAQGLALVLPGHYATERCGVEELAERLRLQWPALDVWSSRRECDPVTWL